MAETTCPCGLTQPSGVEVPLRGVRVTGTVRGTATRITVAQRFCNEEPTPIEAVYRFPLDESASVCGFTAVVGDRRIDGRVMERDQAFDRYDDAMADGDGAFLLDQERPNVFSASVGNLEPGAEVTIEITYVTLAKREGDSVRLMLPTTISPRYVPSGHPEVGEPDGDRVNPPRLPQVPYGFTLDLDVQLGTRIREIESPSHALRTELTDAGARVQLATRQAQMDRDFILLARGSDEKRPSVLVTRREDGAEFAMVRFAPDLSSFDSAGGQEVHFVLDCSGSMGGTSIAEATRALELCVRALDEGDRFNVIAFGSTSRRLWKSPQAFSDATLEKAVTFVRECDATMGGTEILTPLKEILEGARKAEALAKVVLLTDGQVSNEAEVIALVESHRETATVFAFGIGAGVSEHLVRGTARAGGGKAEFIYPGERIEPKVLRTFNRLRAPSLPQPTVDWGEAVVTPAPARLGRVYPGEEVIAFARVGSGTVQSVSLVAGDHQWTSDSPNPGVKFDATIATLWARARIEDLENGSQRRGSQQSRVSSKTDSRRDAVVALATEFSLMSSHTSFVAVETRTGEDRTRADANLRVVPIALTDGWGRSSLPAGRAGFGGTLAFAMAPMAAGAAGPTAGAPPPAPMMQAAPAPMAKSASGGVFAKLKSSFGKSSRGSALPSPGSALPARRERRASVSVDPLYEVLLTQKADGRFVWSEAFESAVLCGGEWTDRADALAITERVLEWFETEHLDRKAEWEMGARKARRWLGRAA